MVNSSYVHHYHNLHLDSYPSSDRDHDHNPDCDRNHVPDRDRNPDHDRDPDCDLVSLILALYIISINSTPIRNKLLTLTITMILILILIQTMTDHLIMTIAAIPTTVIAIVTITHLLILTMTLYR